MSFNDVNMIMKEAVWVAILIISPIMTVSLVLGLSISIFQALTSIQEMTLTYVPKIIVSFLLVVLMGPWMLKVIVQFSRNLIQSIPGIIR